LNLGLQIPLNKKPNRKMRAWTSSSTVTVTTIEPNANFVSVLRLPIDKKDAFESDFESAGEEVEGGGDGERDSVAERFIQEEERKVRRESPKTLHTPDSNHRNRTRKAIRNWGGRRRWLINTNELPLARAVQSSYPTNDFSNRGLQPVVIVDPETGEATEPNKRKSQRTSAVLNRAATINRPVQDAKDKVSFYSPLRRDIQYSLESVPNREETQRPATCSYSERTPQTCAGNKGTKCY